MHPESAQSTKKKSKVGQGEERLSFGSMAEERTDQGLVVEMRRGEEEEGKA